MEAVAVICQKSAASIDACLGSIDAPLQSPEAEILQNFQASMLDALASMRLRKTRSRIAGIDALCYASMRPNKIQKEEFQASMLVLSRIDA